MMFKPILTDLRVEWLLKMARRHGPMTDAEKREQRISFAYGNLALHDETVKKEDVRRLAEEIYGK